MKAFDTLNWSYLMSILTNMLFPEQLRHWITLCISTVSFSINLNGSLNRNFKATRGLRQGDPPSPTLFILAMEGFTQLFQTVIQNHPFSYLLKCQPIRLSSLAFENDLFILSKADFPSIHTIRNILTKFDDLSGLRPNLQKCEVCPCSYS